VQRFAALVVKRLAALGVQRLAALVVQRFAALVVQRFAALIVQRIAALCVHIRNDDKHQSPACLLSKLRPSHDLLPAIREHVGQANAENGLGRAARLLQPVGRDEPRTILVHASEVLFTSGSPERETHQQSRPWVLGHD
jgi:hypothetical protein